MWVSSLCGAARRNRSASTERGGAAVLPSSLGILALLWSGLSAASPALADEGRIYVKQLSAPSIKVIGNGSIYTQVEDGTEDVVVHVRIVLDAGASGLVKTWSAWPQGKMGPGQWFDFKDSGLTVSYPLGSRPKTVDRHETLVIPRSAYTTLVADACNKKAAELRAGGLSNSEVFSSDHLITVPVRGALTYEMSGLSGGLVPPEEAVLDPELMVTCAKVEFGPLTPLTLNQVADSALSISAANDLLGCRLNAAGSITSLQPNETVSFRYVDDQGRKSDVKTVTTSAARIANFTHELPLPRNGGAVSGKVRMVGESSHFQSPWFAYAVTCAPLVGSDDLKTEAPPTVSILEADVKKEVVLGGRWACPSRVWVRAQVSATAEGTATVSLFGNDSLLDLRQFDVKEGSEDMFAAGHDVSWAGFSAAGETSPRQVVTYRAMVATDQSFVADEDERELSLLCRPVWPQTAIKVKVVESAPVDGRFVCPVRYQVIGNLVGRSDVSGTVEIFAEGTPFGPIPFALNDGINLDIVAPAERTLAWKGFGSGGAGGPGPQQAISLSMKVFDEVGGTLAIQQETALFRCTRMAEGDLGQGAQLPGIPSGPQVGLPAGAVQVAGGKVRLIGAKPGAVYALRFYRAKLITGPHLPTRMTNGVANLNLAKMKPGQWRVEVCATRNGRGLQILPNACRDRTFEVRHAMTGGPGQHMQEPEEGRSLIFPGSNPWGN
ncbi:hypothetical protein [Pelagibius sp.]|uniref:hypothetical protein n=1 Tax=Pelagibius sp. TaxID=1931238 RepID=UPI00262BD490|nr:hypothetical protein [Pelagibius sp.]